MKALFRWLFENRFVVFTAILIGGLVGDYGW